MSNLPNPDEVRAVLDPVWFNTHWVKNALGLYEGVSKHAEELNVSYGHFFGLVQKFALDAAVLGICKLFDTSNPAYQKDTVPALFVYLKAQLTNSYVSRLKIETLAALGIPEQDSIRLATGLRTAFDNTKVVFIETVENIIPNAQKDDALKRLLTYRNKVAAHQERLDEALKEQLASLPSLDDMERLNNLATNFCLLSINLLTPNVTLLPGGRSARMAALNVAAKLLDKKFDLSAALDEYKSFFSRI